MTISPFTAWQWHTGLSHWVRVTGNLRCSLDGALEAGAAGFIGLGPHSLMILLCNYPAVVSYLWPAFKRVIFLVVKHKFKHLRAVYWEKNRVQSRKLILRVLDRMHLSSSYRVLSNFDSNTWKVDILSHCLPNHFSGLDEQAKPFSWHCWSMLGCTSSTWWALLISLQTQK